jgi:ABC-type Zn uptake system ZnuABC Zn-binding protein ZnuA
MRNGIVMAIVFSLLATAFAILLALPANTVKPTGMTYVATIQPVAAILQEIVRGRAEVLRLLPPNASPHTYEFTPADAAKAQNAFALVYVGENLDQVWAEKLGAKNKIKLLDLVPNEYRLPNADIEEGEPTPVNVPQGARLPNEMTDAHFWTDPLTVRAVVPGLVNELCRLDKEGEAIYRANAEKFMALLDSLHRQALDILSPVAGKPVFLFHPSFQYLIKRYGLMMEQAVEPSPGKNPTGNDIVNIIEAIHKTGAKAIFTEPQLPKMYAQAIARDAGVKIYELDPEGIGGGRGTYSDFLLYNVNVLREALGQ